MMSVGQKVVMDVYVFTIEGLASGGEAGPGHALGGTVGCGCGAALFPCVDSLHLVGCSM